MLLVSLGQSARASSSPLHINLPRSGAKATSSVPILPKPALSEKKHKKNENNLLYDKKRKEDVLGKRCNIRDFFYSYRRKENCYNALKLRALLQGVI